MSALMAERRDSGRQESLFEGLAPPQPTPWVRPVAAPTDEETAERSRRGGAGGPGPCPKRPSPSPATAGRSPRPRERPVRRAAGSPPPGEARPAKRRLELVRESAEPRSAGAPLGKLTLDDVVSRAWEGLAAGLPVACPLCRSEMSVPLGGPLSGTCTSCGTTID